MLYLTYVCPVSLCTGIPLPWRQGFARGLYVQFCLLCHFGLNLLLLLRDQLLLPENIHVHLVFLRQDGLGLPSSCSPCDTTKGKRPQRDTISTLYGHGAVEGVWLLNVILQHRVAHEMHAVAICVTHNNTPHAYFIVELRCWIVLVEGR